MAFNNANICEIDLTNGRIFRSFQNHAIGEGDALENRYGIRAVRDGEEVSLSGVSCTGYFVRADGTTIVISGTVSGNTAYVTLPAACYAVEGQFSLAIKLTGAGVNGTMRIVDGTVVNTTTDTVVSSGTSVPNVEALTEIIERAEDAAETIAGFSVTAVLRSGSDYTLEVTAGGGG